MVLKVVVFSALLGFSLGGIALSGVPFHQAVSELGFTFTAAGDHGWNSHTDASLAYLETSGSEFHIGLGDLGYTTDETGWCDYFKTRFPTLVFIAGNHDTDETGPGMLSPGYREACPFSLSTSIVGEYGTRYYFDYPTTGPLARFLLVSPGIGGSEVDGDYSAGTANYDFVSNAIDDARSKGINWVVVGMHKGCIYAGDKGSCDVGPGFFNLLFAKRVDLVLHAHAHYYERSHQLSCATPGALDQSCIADSDGSFIGSGGPVIVIDGTFGQGNRPVDAFDAEAGYFASLMYTDYGFTSYTITATRIDARFVSSTGTFEDTFTILRTGVGNELPNPGTWQLSPLAILGLMALVPASIGAAALLANKSRKNHRSQPGEKQNS